MLQIAVKKKGRDEGREGGKKEKNKSFHSPVPTLYPKGDQEILPEVFSVLPHVR